MIRNLFPTRVLSQGAKNLFSARAGPYNPYLYKDYYIPK